MKPVRQLKKCAVCGDGIPKDKNMSWPRYLKKKFCSHACSGAANQAESQARFDTQSLVRTYQQGMSMETIAKKYACHLGTVRNILRRQGIPLRPPGKQPNPVTLTKTCTSCSKEFPRAEFNGDGKRTSVCKSCQAIKTADRYDSDPEFRQNAIARSAAWQNANPDRARSKKRQWSSGWTQELFDQTWHQQKGKCAICQVDLVRVGKSLTSVASDHCHETGKLRALLCSICNRGLGCFKDSPDILLRAADYIREFQR